MNQVETHRGLTRMLPAFLCALLVSVTFAVTAEAGRAKELRYISPALSTMDSYLYTGGMYAQVTLGTKEGLVQLGPDGQSLVPAQAEGWDSSEDGLTYTFYLRKDNRWYDGSVVTAWDYKAAFIRQMEPGRESKWTWDTPFQYVIRALDFRNGAAREEEVGIDVLDDFTLRFRLAKPYPAFMNAMITGSMFPIHRGSVEKYGDEWHKLENYQGNGPYRIVEFELNSHVILEPNPGYNLPRGNLERIICRFAGRPLEAYQSDEIDFALLGTIADIHYARRDSVMSRELVFTPTSGLSFMRFLYSENPVFWDSRVRRAIGLAFDRHRLVNAIFLGRELPVDMLSTPAMPDWDPDFGDRYNVEEARRLLAEAGYPGGKGIPTARILVPSYLAPEMISEFVVIATMLEENLGIRFKIDNQELGVYADKRISLNPADYIGLCFAASGAPWPNPVYATNWIAAVQWTDDPQTYGTWWAGERRVLQIRTGMIHVEGGEKIADFERLGREVLAYEDSVMALYGEGKHGPYLRGDAQEVLRGWLQAAEDIVQQAREPGTNREWLWRAMNLTVMQLQQYYFQWSHASDLRWRVEELGQDALYERDFARQAVINREIHRLVQGHSWDIPLHVANATAVVKPYVKGIKFCSFWWANPLYVKRVSIADEPTGTATQAVVGAGQGE